MVGVTPEYRRTKCEVVSSWKQMCEKAFFCNIRLSLSLFSLLLNTIFLNASFCIFQRFLNK